MAVKRPKNLKPDFEASPTKNPRPNVKKYPPRLKPESNLKNLSVEEYKQAWVKWNAEHPKDPNSFKKFQEVYGEKYEDDVKLKPASKGTKSTLSSSPDKTVKGRWQREQVLNYIFGGETTEIGKEAQAEMNRSGKTTTAHHLRGLAEDGPWVDRIIKLLESPKGSKEYLKGMQLMETSKDYMLSRGLTGKAGTAKENLSMLEGKDPITGRTGESAHMVVHGDMDQANLTAGKASSLDPAARMDHPDDVDLAKKDRRRVPTTQGVKVGDEYTPRMGTIDAINQLPSERIDAFRYTSDEISGGKGRKGKYKAQIREGVNWFSSWADHIEQSSGIREDIDQEARRNHPDQGRALYDVSKEKKYQGARAFAKTAGQSNNPFVNTFGDTSALAIDGLNVILNPTSAGNWVDFTFSAGQAAGSWGGMALMAKGKVKAGQGLMKFSDQLGQAERSLNIGRTGLTKVDAMNTFSERDKISSNRQIQWRRGL